MAYSNTFNGAAKDAADSTANASDLDTQFDAIEADLALKANTAKVEPTGDTSAGDNAAMGYTATEGLVLTGQGSTNDITVKNDADSEVLGVPTGTVNLVAKGSVTTGGNVVSDTDSTDDLGATATRWANVWTDAITVTDTVTLGSDAVYASVLQTEQASTSGTDIDFTSLPSWTKKITVIFSGVSTSGTDNIRIQLGDSGGIEATGYLGTSSYAGDASVTSVNATAGFTVVVLNAANVFHGSLILNLVQSSTNTWVGQGVFGRSDSDSILWTAGTKPLSGILDRIRITTAGGTDTFDAGLINILVE